MKMLLHFKILSAFAGHILVSALVFCLVGTGALVLHAFSAWLAGHGLNGFVLSSLHVLEVLVFACDFVATGSWAISSTLKVIRDLKE